MTDKLLRAAPRHAAAEPRVADPQPPSQPSGQQRRRKVMRKDIQGLRAIAVMLVVLGHLWPLRLDGGYIGVDVFFVISGFLITQHLLREITRTGRIGLAKFYTRRIKRLLPAAVLVSLISLLGAWLFFPFDRWTSIAKETVAATFYVENWYLAAKSVDYSALSDTASTVQHYWSLSVEEQFYLIWPLLLLGAFWVTRRVVRHRVAILFALLSVVGVISLAYSIWFTEVSKPQAYFVTPARAWEFALGGIVGLLLTLPAVGDFFSRHRNWSGGVQWLGYAAIVYAALTFNTTTSFPGWHALIPVLGTAAVILSGPRSPAWSLNRVLETKVPQVLGDVSYSLYLWHWPLIILLPGLTGRPLSTIDKVLIVAIGVMLSILSKRLVEDAAQKQLLAPFRPRSILLMTGTTMAVVALLGYTMALGATGRQTDQQRHLDDLAASPCFGAGTLHSENDCRSPFDHVDIQNVGPDQTPWFDVPQCQPTSQQTSVTRALRTDCDFSVPGQPADDVWLVGDSHAEQWKANVYPLAKERGWRLHTSLLGGCPYVPVKLSSFSADGKAAATSQAQQECRVWGDETSQLIQSAKPKLVMAASFGAFEHVDDSTGRSQQEQYNAAVRTRFAEWRQAGVKVMVLRDTPMTLDRSTPTCVAQNLENPTMCSVPRDQALPPDVVATAAERIGDPGIQVLDASDQFCDADRCYAAIGGINVFYDSNHVSRTYMSTVGPVFKSRFDAALVQAG